MNFPIEHPCPDKNYKIVEGMEGVFDIFKNGEIAYVVREDYCSCPGYSFRRYCKHNSWIKKILSDRRNPGITHEFAEEAIKDFYKNVIEICEDFKYEIMNPFDFKILTVELIIYSKDSWIESSTIDILNPDKKGSNEGIFTYKGKQIRIHVTFKDKI